MENVLQIQQYVLFLPCSLWIGLSLLLLSLLHFAGCVLKHQQSCSLFTLHADWEQAVRQTQNSHKWCESLLWGSCLPLLMAGLARADLVGLPCVSQAGCVGGDACVLLSCCLTQKAGTKWPNIHAQKYVIVEMLDCVWGEFCGFVSQNLYFARLCVGFQKQFGWIHECFCLFSHCVDFLFQELFFLSINNNKEDDQGLQCRWSARMILSSCVNRFRVWWNKQSLGNVSASSGPISGSAAAAYV